MAVAARAVALLSLALVFGNLVSASKYDTRNGRQNINMGHRRVYPNYPVDTLLFKDEPKDDGSWLRVVSHDVCYPPKGSHPAKFSITAFNVTDLVPKGKGGYAFVADGGVGSGKLCLHFKSQRGGPYKFNVAIYGYYV